MTTLKSFSVLFLQLNSNYTNKTNIYTRQQKETRQKSERCRWMKPCLWDHCSHPPPPLLYCERVTILTSEQPRWLSIPDHVRRGNFPRRQIMPRTMASFITAEKARVIPLSIFRRLVAGAKTMSLRRASFHNGLFFFYYCLFTFIIIAVCLFVAPRGRSSRGAGAIGWCGLLAVCVPPFRYMRWKLNKAHPLQCFNSLACASHGSQNGTCSSLEH